MSNIQYPKFNICTSDVIKFVRSTYYETLLYLQAFKLILTHFILPVLNILLQTIFTNKEVTQVNVPAITGDMGILANHVPVVEQLKPGVVEILEGTSSSKFFISGGFVSVLPDSTIAITTVEAFPLSDFEPATVKNLLTEAKKNATSSDEKVAAEASIEVEVLEALTTALH